MNIRRIEFASMLTYSPRSYGKEHRKSQRDMRLLKADGQLPSKLRMSEKIADAIRDQLHSCEFSDYFGPDVALVPAPKSSPHRKGDLWVPQRLAYEMEEAPGKESQVPQKAHPRDKVGHGRRPGQAQATRPL